LNDRDIPIAVVRDCRPEHRARIAPDLHSIPSLSLCGMTA